MSYREWAIALAHHIDPRGRRGCVRTGLRDRAILLLYGEGVGPKEIAALTDRNVITRGDNGFVRLPGHGGVRRGLRLTLEAVDLLEELRRDIGDGHLIRGQNGRPLTTSGVKAVIRRRAASRRQRR